MGCQYDADGTPLVWPFLDDPSCRPEPISTLSPRQSITTRIAQVKAMEKVALHARLHDDEASPRALAAAPPQSPRHGWWHIDRFLALAGHECLGRQCLCL